MDLLNQFNGLLNTYTYSSLITIIAFIVIGYMGAPLIIWSVAGLAALVGFSAPTNIILIYLAAAVLFNIKPLRAQIVSRFVLKLMNKMGLLPKISETERVALDAGVVWVEKDLFSGKPDFKKLMQESYPNLTPEEKAFMDGPLNNLCEMTDDWQVWKQRELPEKVWNFIKKEKFFGMIIPKEYGGLGFSALAHSHVISVLASRCAPLTITVMVPNSLGPAELLIHYGTDEQKDYYLPRLATGEEIPCFGLTEPQAGSDAGSIKADGVLFKGADGKLYMRMNWNKRWITLASISTVMGIAFRLRDPENLLGKGEDVGITCALIPTNTQGVIVGQRHDPMGVPFYNCPTQGKDVVVPADYIIGGVKNAGHGWQMLMESLAAGRGISLPAQITGGVQLCARVASAHAVNRQQFGVSIGKFEGIEQPLARIAGWAYMLEALRKYTIGALDKGIKPPVITAMTKYNSTEIGRKAVNDTMDIMAGAGISRGPRNLIYQAYSTVPIGITVEGANILTRTLIIFGQGALRAHPFAYQEVIAAEKNDVKAFDVAFWGHIGHVVRNLTRAVCLSLTRGRITFSPFGGSTAKYYRRLSWMSATFAIMSDIAMASLGGALKQKEKITGRFADVLSWMYISTAILRRFIADGSKKEDLPFVHYSMNYALFEIQKAFDGIFRNLKVPGLSWLFNGPLSWWSNFNAVAGEDNDSHSKKIAQLIMTDSEQRDRISACTIYMPTDIHKEQLARVDHAFKLVKKSEAIDKKMRTAIRAGQLEKLKGAKLIEAAFSKGVITSDEKNLISEAQKWRDDAIQVDDFSQEEFLGHKPTTDSPQIHNSKQSSVKIAQ
ncbi:MAG: acyl-CoA dehydrogenase [Oligoflexia bacterium]|nr:acyl-CoA dehydrogenase [Oligoflexia bacterium]